MTLWTALAEVRQRVDTQAQSTVRGGRCCMSDEPITLRFWRWLYKLAERQIVERFLRHHSHDRMCPNCKRWSALTGEWAEQIELGRWLEGLTCKACDYTSHWKLDSMLPYLDKPQPHHVVKP